MTDQSQDDIDALMGDLENSSDPNEGQQTETVEEKSNPIGTEASSAEDTGESLSNQGKDAEVTAESGGSGDPEPWVDFVPADGREKPVNLIDHVERAVEDAEFALKEEEMLHLAYVEQEIDIAYYDEWVRRANERMRQSVALKNRLKSIKEKQAAKSSEENTSQDIAEPNVGVVAEETESLPQEQLETEDAS